MKLAAGEYRVVAVLNVSRSLLSQSKGDTHKPGDVYKVLLQASGTNYVSYFVDGIDFGPSSLITFRKDAQILVYKEDYEVIESVSLVDNKIFVDRLIEKLRKKAG